MLKYHLHMLQYLNHPPTGCNGKFLQLHWSLLRGQLDYGSHSSKLSLMAQHNRLHLDWASVHYSLNNASEPPLQYRFLNLTEYFVVPWPLTLIPNRFPAVRPRNYFILMLESCLSLPSHTTLRAIKTFTGSCSRSKSCGWPAAYTKKYVAEEELGIILSSILQKMFLHISFIALHNPFIFLHFYFIFLHSSFIFLHIFHIFLHFCFIFLHIHFIFLPIFSIWPLP